MNDPRNIPIDFNKIAAYLDGHLSPEEMANMESYASSDLSLSRMFDELDEINKDITDTLCSDSEMAEIGSLDVELPVLAGTSEHYYFEPGDISMYSSLSIPIEDSHLNLDQSEGSLEGLDDETFSAL